jgi:HK97 family phage major capsid protein
MDELKKQLEAFINKAKDEMERLGKVTSDTAAQVQALQARLDAAEVEKARPSQPQANRLRQMLQEHEGMQKLFRDRRGSAVIQLPGIETLIEQRTTITSSAVGSASSGVLLFERTPGIVPAARRRLFIRDLLTVIPTQFNAIDFVKVNSDIQKASPQVEASAKYENALTFTTDTETVRTIATWIPATRQVLEDFEGLESFIRESLTYAVLLEEENQILSGSGTGENLNGLITQATPFNTGLLSASHGWEKIDILGRAVQQIQSANEVEPDFVVLHPKDFWDIRLSKDSTGVYLFGNPFTPFDVTFFGLRPFVTTGITQGTFLVGSSAPTSAVIRQRTGLSVEISTEHSDFFTKNMVAIRAEERLALVVFRPGAYITGSLTTSPA